MFCWVTAGPLGLDPQPNTISRAIAKYFFILFQ
jgi:hypothetical protein